MFGILPRETVFFDFFEQAAGVVLDAAEAYADVARDYSRREQHIGRIRQCEHEGDDIAHRTLDKLDKSFITPFDREDIQSLMMQIDDVIDEIDAASKRLTLPLKLPGANCTSPPSGAGCVCTGRGICTGGSGDNIGGGGTGATSGPPGRAGGIMRTSRDMIGGVPTP